MLEETDLVGQLGPPKRRGTVEVYPCYYGGIPMPWSGVSIAHGFAFAAGAEGWDVRNMDVVRGIAQQTWLTLDKIRARLEAVGTSMDNIVLVSIYVIDILEYHSEAKLVIRKFFQQYCPKFLEKPPAITLIQVAALARRAMRIEIDAIASMDPKRGGEIPISYPLEYDNLRMDWAKATVARGLSFISPTEGCNPKTLEVASSLEEQTRISLEKLRDRLDDVGSSLQNLLKLNIEVTDVEAFYREAFNPGKVIHKFYHDHAEILLEEPPPMTVLQVPALAKKDMKIQIGAIAAIPRSSSKNSRVVKYFPISYWNRPLWSSGSTTSDFAFLAETDSTDPSSLSVSPNLEEQTYSSLRQASERLQQMGTSLENITYSRTYCIDLDDFHSESRGWVIPKFSKENCPVLGELPSSQTLLQVSALSRKRLNFAFEGIAAIPNANV